MCGPQDNSNYHDYSTQHLVMDSNPIGLKEACSMFSHLDIHSDNQGKDPVSPLMTLTILLLGALFPVKALENGTALKGHCQLQQ